jgi:hypothetical protein
MEAARRASLPCAFEGPLPAWLEAWMAAARAQQGAAAFAAETALVQCAPGGGDQRPAQEGTLGPPSAMEAARWAPPALSFEGPVPAWLAAARAQQEAAELADQTAVSTLHAQGGDAAPGTEGHPGPPVRFVGGVEGPTGK